MNDTENNTDRGAANVGSVVNTSGAQLKRVAIMLIIILGMFFLVGLILYKAFSREESQQKADVGKATVNASLAKENKKDKITVGRIIEPKVPSLSSKRNDAIPVIPRRRLNPPVRTAKKRSRFDSPLFFEGDRSSHSSERNRKEYLVDLSDQPEVLVPEGRRLGNNLDLETIETPKSYGESLGKRDYILAKGSMIECSLETAINSTIPGMTSCIVSKNIYSDNGNTVLIERGSKITGEYRSDVVTGQNRLGIVWGRIKTAKGVIVDLSSPTTDTLGRSGVGGHLDNRWWERLGAAFLISIIKDAIAYEAARLNSSVGNSVYSNTTSTGESMAEIVLKETMKVRPVITKNQGSRISIFVARDLDFSDIYKLKTIN